jgi:hypothetical protein
LSGPKIINRFGGFYYAKKAALAAEKYGIFPKRKIPGLFVRTFQAIRQLDKRV